MADEQNIGAGLEERIIDADIDADSNREENRADFELEMIEKLKAGKCSIEYALLVASGLKDKKDIRRYQGKLSWIIKDFKEEVRKKVCEKITGGFHADNAHNIPDVRISLDYLLEKEEHKIHTARMLFGYLFERKPNRYRQNEYHLTDVIDNQLDEYRHTYVGNCLGLTLLYTVLGLRIGLKLSVLDEYKHVLNLLRAGRKKIPIQNTNELDGFNSEHIKIRDYDEFDLTHLVCNVVHNRGTEKEWSGDLKGAIKDYEKAIMLNPKFPEAHHSLGEAKYELGELEEAVKLFDIAIELYKKSRADKKEGLYNAFLIRGDAKDDLGDPKGAIEDYNQIINGCVVHHKRYYSYFTHNRILFKAYYNKGIVLEKTGRLKEAIDSYLGAITVLPDFAEPLFRIGELYEKAGMAKEAGSYYRKGLRVDREELRTYHPLDAEITFPYITDIKEIRKRLRNLKQSSAEEKAAKGKKAERKSKRDKKHTTRLENCKEINPYADNNIHYEGLYNNDRLNTLDK